MGFSIAMLLEGRWCRCDSWWRSLERGSLSCCLVEPFVVQALHIQQRETHRPQQTVLKNGSPAIRKWSTNKTLGCVKTYLLLSYYTIPYFGRINDNQCHEIRNDHYLGTILGALNYEPSISGHPNWSPKTRPWPPWPPWPPRPGADRQTSETKMFFWSLVDLSSGNLWIII